MVKLQNRTAAAAFEPTHNLVLPYLWRAFISGVSSARLDSIWSFEDEDKFDSILLLAAEASIECPGYQFKIALINFFFAMLATHKGLKGTLEKLAGG